MKHTRWLLPLVAATLAVVAGCGDSPALQPSGVTVSNKPSTAVAEFALTCPESAVASANLAPTAALPDKTFSCLGGGSPLSLASLRGRPTILHVWASWCQVCREDMPAVLAAQSRLGSSVQFIGVDWKDDVKSARGYAAAAKLTFPSIIDPDGAVGALWGINVQPATVFIRADGTIAHTHVGSFRTAEKLVAAAREYLG